jgi:hypothetical protein
MTITIYRSSCIYGFVWPCTFSLDICLYRHNIFAMWETKRVRNKFSVRGPIFKRAETTSWEGLGRLKILDPRTLNIAFTRQKLRVPCPKNGSACQNLTVPCAKWLSCKRGFKIAVFYNLNSADVFDQSYDLKIISHARPCTWKKWAVAHRCNFSKIKSAVPKKMGPRAKI